MKPRAFTFAITTRAGPRHTCARCRGFMVPSSTDSRLLEITEQPAVPAWRCVNCGEWIDATVVMNRKRAGIPGDTVPSSLIPLPRRRWRW